MIYLDNAATTFPKPRRVYDAVMYAMVDYGANPGRSGHKLALQAGRKIYETRETLAKLFNIDNPMNIVFTCNATESLNLGINGLLNSGDHVITSSMEHNSVLRPLNGLKNLGIETSIIQCDKEGNIDVSKIERAIKENTKAIVMTHASNVTGTIFPIKDIGKIAKKHNIIYMVDSAQTAGVYDLDVKDMNIDLLAFPGHKGLLGPQGTGGLYIREGIDLAEMKKGGTGSKSNEIEQPKILPDRYESGTSNTPGIAGLNDGVNYIVEKGMENIRRHEENLTKRFISGLESIKEITIYGPSDLEKRASVISMNIKDFDSSEVSYILDSSFDIATRSGLHCAPLAHKTLGTMNIGTVRFSIGPFNTEEDIDQAINAVYLISKNRY
ncbi:aminotransferase class V-fold PLP-dependent enzyme [Clostridiisalibacter paucivorans]|uniref:aminotransferase class V-fold PLP-dependent enzyme n=1 Tax=Clostridiisalibacter paucivorans TaxID=408753 RepID=UPI0004797727|nr:aminotransferase class V-fold PLP-dependent enzyme [Clostridiisalibacter paucivorans]